MTRRVWLRASALAVVVLGAVAVLTVYYSSESVPPCLVSGVPTWRPPTDGATHRFMVVFPDRAACFFDLDDQNKLVGALRLPDARGISFAAQLQDDVAVRTASGPMTLDLRTGRLRRGGLVPFPNRQPACSGHCGAPEDSPRGRRSGWAHLTPHGGDVDVRPRAAVVCDATRARRSGV